MRIRKLMLSLATVAMLLLSAAPALAAISTTWRGDKATLSDSHRTVTACNLSNDGRALTVQTKGSTWGGETVDRRYRGGCVSKTYGDDQYNVRLCKGVPGNLQTCSTWRFLS